MLGLYDCIVCLYCTLGKKSSWNVNHLFTTQNFSSWYDVRMMRRLFFLIPCISYYIFSIKLKYNWTPYFFWVPFIIGVNIKEGTAATDIVRRVQHWFIRRRDRRVLTKTIQGQFHFLRPGHVQRPRLHRNAQDQESAELFSGLAV